MPSHYRLNEPDASAELFDEEVLAINLSNGHYHSLRGSGGTLWKCLMAGSSREETSQAIRDLSPTPPADVEADIHAFVAGLQEAGLITGTEPPATPVNLAQIITPSEQAYSVPTFESHTDMQDLLMIDPIHDVDVKMGWPLRSDAGPV